MHLQSVKSVWGRLVRAFSRIWAVTVVWKKAGLNWYLRRGTRDTVAVLSPRPWASPGARQAAHRFGPESGSWTHLGSDPNHTTLWLCDLNLPDPTFLPCRWGQLILTIMQ